ncbi:crossover junction endonuclease EME1 [Schistosoma japonicum]|nr:crossover junction endonuclease EME1 [Schistosoma japonicum]
MRHLTASNDQLEKSVSKQLPSLIQPKNVGLNGLSGSVPISYSVTWTRYHPTLEVLTKSLKYSGHCDGDLSHYSPQKLITCEFDENILQVSNLLASLTSKLGKKSVSKQLPSLIQPKNVGLNGLSGSVPISYSVTWTRYHPTLEVLTKKVTWI